MTTDYNVVDDYTENGMTLTLTFDPKGSLHGKYRAWSTVTIHSHYTHDDNDK